MENKIIELTQSKEGNRCLICSAVDGYINIKIQRIHPVDSIISFHVCDKCLSQMQNDINKICE
jgi:hypothetical protein